MIRCRSSHYFLREKVFMVFQSKYNDHEECGLNSSHSAFLLTSLYVGGQLVAAGYK